MKKLAILLIPVFFSLNLHAAEPTSSLRTTSSAERYALPAMGAGLLGWGAYELGSNPSEGRRNLRWFAGATAAAAGGALLYKKWKKRKRGLSLGAGSVQSAPALVLRYSY